MHTNLTIYNELKELSTTLAEISPVNVYSVPDGYFDATVPAILLHIYQPEIAGRETTNMEVPAGYFEGLADNIMNRIKSESTTETVDTAFIDPIKNINVYSVPDGYFDLLPASILHNIKTAGEDVEEESSLLAPAKNINVYTVPAGYFDSVATSVIGNLYSSDEDIEEESSLLASAKNINVYTVPAGYFDTVSREVMSKLSIPAKVVSMGKRPAIIKYAVAAVVTGMLGFSLVNFFNKGGNKTEVNAAATAMISNANKINEDGSFDKEFETLSDADITGYLQASGQDVNAALVASVTDDKTLPSEEEFLTDDNTLDNFLNELNISGSNSSTN